jgi:CRP-like cAMP-binding protein/membrane protease YdiL (CAAX protease family)
VFRRADKRGIALFSGLSRRELARIERACSERTLRQGEVLIREGDRGDEMYVLLSGGAEVLRKDARGAEYVVGDVTPGELVGEVGMLEGRRRTATVRATEPSKVMVVPAAVLHSQPRLLINLARAMSERVRAQSDLSLEYARERSAMAELMIKSLVLLCAYAVLLSALPWVRATWPGASTTYLSLPVIALFGYSSYRFIRATGWPLSRFGLGFRDSLGSIVEALIFTPPFAAALVAVKWLMVRIVPAWRGLPTIEHTDIVARLADPEIRWLLSIYAASALVQELIVRSALQASLEDFLSGRGRSVMPILVAALMFSVNHLHMSFVFALLAFLPGLFWGWLFQRKRHLAGVTLSHFAIGAFVFFVLGVRLQ